MNFTITKPDGGVVTKSMKTTTSASAVFKFKVRKQDPVGIYQVRADANLNNAIFGSASTSFTVQ